MKKLILVALFIITITLNLRAQNKDYEVQLSAGFGLYDPGRTGETGNVLFSKLMFELPSKVFVGAGIASSLVFNEIESFIGLNGERSYDHYLLYSIHIDKHFSFGSNERHTLTIGSGLIYVDVRYAKPQLIVYDNGNSVIVGLIESNSKQNNFGSLINLEYFSKFGKVQIGVNANLHLLMNVGYGGYTIAPAVKVGF